MAGSVTAADGDGGACMGSEEAAVCSVSVTRADVQVGVDACIVAIVGAEISGGASAIDAGAA